MLRSVFDAWAFRLQEPRPSTSSPHFRFRSSASSLSIEYYHSLERKVHAPGRRDADRAGRTVFEARPRRTCQRSGFFAQSPHACPARRASKLRYGMRGTSRMGKFRVPGLSVSYAHSDGVKVGFFSEARCGERRSGHERSDVARRKPQDVAKTTSLSQITLHARCHSQENYGRVEIST